MTILHNIYSRIPYLSFNLVCGFLFVFFIIVLVWNDQLNETIDHQKPPQLFNFKTSKLNRNLNFFDSTVDENLINAYDFSFPFYSFVWFYWSVKPFMPVFICSYVTESTFFHVSQTICFSGIMANKIYKIFLSPLLNLETSNKRRIFNPLLKWKKPYLVFVCSFYFFVLKNMIAQKRSSWMSHEKVVIETHHTFPGVIFCYLWKYNNSEIKHIISLDNFRNWFFILDETLFFSCMLNNMMRISMKQPFLRDSLTKISIYF